MRYTKPTIVNETKAATQIMGTSQKRGQLFEAIHPTLKTVPPAYEADE